MNARTQEITLAVSELKEALPGLTKIIGKSKSLPVLQTVRINRNFEGIVTLHATDLDSFVTHTGQDRAAGGATGHQMTGSDGQPIHYGNGIEFSSDAHDCLVDDYRLWEIYDAALTNQGDGTNVQENLTYRRNVIWNSEYSFEYWNRGQASRTRNVVFEHNTCVD